MLSILAAVLAVAVAAAAQHGDAEAARLVERAFAGRRDALRALTLRLLPVVQARVGVFFARRRGRPVGAADAADLVQDVWLALVAEQGRLLRAYDPSRGMSLEGYVGLLCRRELWKATQRQASEKRGGGSADADLDAVRPPADDAPTPEQQAVQRDLVDALWRHLDGELPARGRLVLRYLYADGLPAGEAAELMRVNTQVVYNWQHKIRTLARAWMAAQQGA